MNEKIRNDSYLSKRGYVITKEVLEKDELNELKKVLVARPLVDKKFIGNNCGNGIQTDFPVYIQTKNKIIIPKMYGIKKYGMPTSFLPNYIGEEWDHPIEFNGSLYESQIEPVNTLIKSCKENGGGILSLKTGGGKTISLLYVLSKLKGKTIVVVNKVSLLAQWKSEISQFLPDARVGVIQGQKKIDVEDKDIVIAMLQSLARIDYPDSLFKDYQITVLDEIHNTSSRIFSKILFKLCSKYTIGLSATPTRSDGCEYVFKWHIGDIVYKSKSERKGMHPIIRELKITSNEYKEVSAINKFTGQKTIQFTSMLSELVSMEKRNKLIIEIIKNCRSEGRKILVLSDRRNHLQLLYNILEKDLHINFTYGLFLGSMKITELEKSKACDVILATYAAFGEGVSEKDLDTLLLTTPKKFIGHLKNTSKNESGKLEQILGRIFRKEHDERNPLIIDFADDFSVYKTQSAGRRNFYKNHFKHAIFENCSINLDEHEDVSVNYIQKKKVKEQLEKNEAVEKLQMSMLSECCIMD